MDGQPMRHDVDAESLVLVAQLRARGWRVALMNETGMYDERVQGSGEYRWRQKTVVGDVTTWT